MASFFDYYGGRPTIPDPTPPPSLTPAPIPAPIDPRYMLRPEYRPGYQEEDPTPPNQAAVLIGGSKPPLDIAGLTVINPEDVIHGDFGEYLSSVGMERSGSFGSITNPNRSEDARNFPLIDVNLLTDPTGAGRRAVSTSGYFNPIAAARISQEFQAINEIAKFNGDEANKGLKGNARGFMIRLGDERGSILYRLPGSGRYAGDLSVNGQDIPQNVARNIERYMTSVETGSSLLAAIAEGGDAVSELAKDNDFSDSVIKTGRGGYTLDGRFNYVTGVGSIGRASDFKDLTETTFRVVTDGKYDQVASNAIATSWMNGARGFGPDVTQAELIAHLQAHISRATKQSDVSKGTSKKPDTATDTSRATDTSTDKPVITFTGESAAADAAAAGYSGLPSVDEEGRTRLRETAQQRESDRVAREYDYRRQDDVDMSPSQAKAASAEASRYEAAAAAYNAPAIRDSSISPTAGRQNTLARAEGGTVGFVEDKDRLVPQDSILTVNELKEDVQQSGFIDKPASQVSDAESVADDVPIPEAEEDGFVINVEAVKLAGEMDLMSEIEQAEKYVKSKGIDLEKSKQPILGSKGEVYVRPELVPIIGLNKLEKINKRGVPATKQKLKNTKRA